MTTGKAKATSGGNSAAKSSSPKSRKPWVTGLLFAVGVLFWTSLQYALGYWLPPQSLLQWINITVASHVALVCRIFDPDLVRTAAIITSQGFSIEVIFECTGAFTMFILNGMILSWPSPWIRKIIGVVGGCAVLYFFNLARMSTLVFVGARWPQNFDTFHKYFWQATFIAVVLLCWFVWLEWFSGNGRKV